MMKYLWMNLVGHDGKMSGFCYDVGTLHDVERNIYPRPSYSVNKYKIYMGIEKRGKFPKKLYAVLLRRWESITK